MTVTAKRILVVENEKLLRETRVMLAESEGYSVISVSSDDDALSLLETERFDLIVTGRNTELHVGLDERLRAMYATLLTLKIDYLTNRYPQRFSPEFADSARSEIVCCAVVSRSI
jgi:DNA-binding NtrC family response regulator